MSSVTAITNQGQHMSVSQCRFRMHSADVANAISRQKLLSAATVDLYKHNRTVETIIALTLSKLLCVNIYICSKISVTSMNWSEPMHGLRILTEFSSQIKTVGKTACMAVCWALAIHSSLFRELEASPLTQIYCRVERTLLRCNSSHVRNTNDTLISHQGN
jgi:hypothetical protein